MTNGLILLGGIAVLVWIVALLDWYARRTEHKSPHRPT